MQSCGRLCRLGVDRRLVHSRARRGVSVRCAAVEPHTQLSPRQRRLAAKKRKSSGTSGTPATPATPHVPPKDDIPTPTVASKATIPPAPLPSSSSHTQPQPPPSTHRRLPSANKPGTVSNQPPPTTSHSSINTRPSKPAAGAKASKQPPQQLTQQPSTQSNTSTVFTKQQPPAKAPARPKQRPPSPTHTSITWSVFSSPDSIPNTITQSSTSPQPPATPQFAPSNPSMRSMSNEQLSTLALTWAQEVCMAVGAGQGTDSAAHLTTHPHDDSTQSEKQRRRTSIAQCAATPHSWWSSLSSHTKIQALANISSLASEALQRLGLHDDNSAGHLPLPINPSPDSHVAHQHLQSIIRSGFTPASSLNTRPQAGDTTSHTHQDVNRGQQGGGKHDRADAAATAAAAVASGSVPVTGGATELIGVQGVSNVQGVSKGINDPQPLTRQQHADISWCVSHLHCSMDPQVLTLMMQLHAALKVPFCVMPLVLPGLSLDAFQEEVELKRDVIWLDGGTRAVEEPRMTGWQSELAATFRYSGKEMQPQAGGLSPQIAEVRNVLTNVTGVKYDSVLINLYDGRCGMRYHADPLYGCWTPETAVVSIGQPRQFVFRDTLDHSVRWSFTVRTGDVAIMFGDCQDRLQHSIITESREVDPRMSLVFKERIPGTL